MDNFIWIGDQAVNLNRVAFFSVEREGLQVVAVLSGVAEKNSRIAVDGKQAEDLIDWLDAHVQTISASEVGARIVCPQIPVNPDPSVMVELGPQKR